MRTQPEASSIESLSAAFNTLSVHPTLWPCEVHGISPDGQRIAIPPIRIHIVARDHSNPKQASFEIHIRAVAWDVAKVMLGTTALTLCDRSFWRDRASVPGELRDPEAFDRFQHSAFLRMSDSVEAPSWKAVVSISGLSPEAALHLDVKNIGTECVQYAYAEENGQTIYEFNQLDTTKSVNLVSTSCRLRGCWPCIPGAWSTQSMAESLMSIQATLVPRMAEGRGLWW